MPCLPLLAATALTWSAPAIALQESSRAPLLDYRQVQVAMSRIASEHGDLAQVIAVGAQSSRGGRKLEALRLSAGKLESGRPAILLVASIEGPRAWTSGFALDHARRLAEGYASDPRIKAWLDTTTLYVIPRANPDASEARFAQPLAEVQASGTGVDDDRDGRQGEDPPSDLDGDRVIAWMRVPDPQGKWLADPTDPRATIEADAKKGQKGVWKLVREGRDADKDEEASEDAERNAFVNRNFPQGWKEHAPESGLFPTDEPETRDLCEFVLEHEDIALVIVYGALDDLSGKPKTVKDDAPNVKRLPPEGMPETDAAFLEEVGRRYEKAAAARPKETRGKSEGDDHGTFQAWCRYQRGLWCVSQSLWSIPLDGDDAKKDGKGTGDAKAGDEKDSKEGAGAQEPPKEPPKEPSGAAQDAAPEKQESKEKKDKDEPKPSDEAKRLRWIDAHGESARFLPWKPFRHPELGDVEIGGLAPYATIEPPEAERDAIAAAELEFLIELGGMLPRVRILECTAKDLGAGVWEIEASVQNDALLPLTSIAGRRSQGPRPARASIRVPEGGRLLAGEREQLFFELAGSGGLEKLRWVVYGATPQSVAVEVDTDSAGTARAVPQVK